MTSKRDLKREVEQLSHTTDTTRDLRQQIPWELVEEWEDVSGHDLEYLRELDGGE